MAKRTNCDNCGGVLVDGKCPYCKAEWFKPGITIGRSGYVGELRVERHAINQGACGRDLNGVLRLGKPRHVNKITLTLIDLSDDDVSEILIGLDKVIGR